jgi:hypothetical protein
MLKLELLEILFSVLVNFVMHVRSWTIRRQFSRTLAKSYPNKELDIGKCFLSKQSVGHLFSNVVSQEQGNTIVNH